MNRVIAAAAALATVGTAALVAAATVGPAMAAPRPAAAHHIAHATADARATALQRAKVASQISYNVISALDGGRYVTTVQCQGKRVAPPPIGPSQAGLLLTVYGPASPPAEVAKLLHRSRYRTVYVCVVVVKEKVPAKPRKTCEIKGGGGTKPGSGCIKIKSVTLNTGYGGMASQVTRHHPAG